jgi:hypothetical protein
MQLPPFAHCFAAVVGGLAVVGCDGDATGLLDRSHRISEFVAGQPLPGVVEPSVTHFRGYDGAVFTVWFGDHVRCSGNFMGQVPTCPQWAAIGVTASDRIGWLYVGAPDGVVDPSREIDFFDGEPALYDPSFWVAFHAADTITYQQTFKQRLVYDPDVPLTVLRRIAEELRGWIAPWLAEELLAHPQAGIDCQVLHTIASLSSVRDAWAPPREEAARRLELICA